MSFGYTNLFLPVVLLSCSAHRLALNFGPEPFNVGKKVAIKKPNY